MISQYLFCDDGCSDGADSMFVYVTAGPIPFAIPLPSCARERKFFSSTRVERLWAAWAMLGGRGAAPAPAGNDMGVRSPFPLSVAGVAGVAAAVVLDAAANGVEAPELFWLASTEASLREDSESICFTFLLRRAEGFQWGLRKGRGVRDMSSWSRSFWWESSVVEGGGGMVADGGGCGWGLG